MGPGEVRGRRRRAERDCQPPGVNELETTRERVSNPVTKRRAAGKDLGGRRPQFTDSQIRNAHRLITAGEPPTQVARDLGMSRATLYRRIAGLTSA